MSTENSDISPSPKAVAFGDTPTAPAFQPPPVPLTAASLGFLLRQLHDATEAGRQSISAFHYCALFDRVQANLNQMIATASNLNNALPADQRQPALEAALHLSTSVANDLVKTRKIIWTIVAHAESFCTEPDQEKLIRIVQRLNESVQELQAERAAVIRDQETLARRLASIRETVDSMGKAT